jgi:predicted phage baseplate assembly protein
LNFSSGHFSVQGDPWPNTLATPAKLLGNIVSTSRGETVNGEFIGSGDASTANQSFTLKKSPLTYLPVPAESTPSGLTSTLRVYVDGLQWTETPSFYGHRPEDEIYIVRQNDKNETVVTFGDGVFGRRLNTGAALIAYYRHGGGAITPPAGSITQVAKPVKGLKSVRSPVAPYGGADAEPANSLQKYAPRSALLLGRAVSLPDLEAAAASYSGVRAVAAEWRWSTTLQVPAAHIWYLADGDLTELILNKLRSLTQLDTPIQIERAAATVAKLSIQLAYDPKRFEADVLTSARTALLDVETGLLAPERLGIGKPLFRSMLFDFLLSVRGVTSVTGLSYGPSPFSDYGIKPTAGHYFDFSSQLYLNGRNS